METAVPRRRGDIEGLRAIAVAVVVAYHCRVPGFSGGFVGVDVFFALSGYLMTGLLVDERASSGTIDLRAFYARRIRRLLPASTVVVLGTLVAGWFVLDPLSLRQLAADAIAVSTYTVNMRFAAQGSDYLQAGGGASALLHHWSLAVEEQFYLVWPVLLLVASGRIGDRAARLRRVAVTLAIVAGASFAMSLLLLHDHPVWTFYGLHTRAWEFAAGGLALLAGRVLSERALRVRAFTGWAGLALVIASVTMLDDLSPFPGWRAVPAVVGTLLVLDSVRSARGPARLLDRPPMVWIGGHSYSIYLYHWPPLVLVPVALGRPMTGMETFGVMAAAVVAAVVSQALIEDPVRHARSLASRRSATYAMAASLAVVSIGAASAVRWTTDLTGKGAAAAAPETESVDGKVVVAELTPSTAPSTTTTAATSATQTGGSSVPTSTAPATTSTSTVPPAVPAPANLTPSLAAVGADAPVIYADGCHVDFEVVVPPDCSYGTIRSNLRVVLFGDSHAAQWFPALERLAVDDGWRLEPLTKSGCPSVGVTVFNAVLKREFTECDEWRQAAFERIESNPPDVIVVANLSSNPLASGAEGVAAEDEWAAGLRSTLRRLVATGADVVLIGTLPSPSTNAPTCVAAHLDDVTRCSTPRSEAVDLDQLRTEQQVTEDLDVSLLDPTDWVCSPDDCPAVVGKYLVYRDRTHLTTAYSRFLAPVIAGTGALAPVGSD